MSGRTRTSPVRSRIRTTAAGSKGLQRLHNLSVMDGELITAPELARELGVDPKRLRQVIRDHRLVPDHQKGMRYQLDALDVARVRSHPAVRALPRRVN